MAPITTLKNWFRKDLRYANWDRDVEILKDTETECSIRVYTDTHSYRIGAMVREDGTGYLGCEASTRKPRAGEDHTRGNDLPDGLFTRANWQSILGSIVGYELMKIHREVPKPGLVSEAAEHTSHSA
jgi:hypothetical protein